MKDRLYFWCRRQSHHRKYCPARGTICNNCNKKERFQSVFLSMKPYPRKVHVVQEQEVEDIHLLVEIGCQKNYWSAHIGVNVRTTRLRLTRGRQ